MKVGGSTQSLFLWVPTFISGATLAHDSAKGDVEAFYSPAPPGLSGPSIIPITSGPSLPSDYI